MKLYQLTYLILPDLSEQDLKAFQEKVAGFIQTEGGTLQKTETPIKRKIGYHIRRKDMALLGSQDFILAPEKIETLKKKLDKEDQILRYMLLTKKTPKSSAIPAKPLTPSPVKKEKVELKEIEKKLDEILKE